MYYTCITLYRRLFLSVSTTKKRRTKPLDINPYSSTNEARLVLYDSSIHLKSIVDVLTKTTGSSCAFCEKHDISDLTMWSWIRNYPEFADAYRKGMTIAKRKWEIQGELGSEDEEWSFKLWDKVGETRFGISKNGKIRLTVDPYSSPIEHYKQIMEGASNGEYSSSEFKQVMEGLNVGLKAHELISLQDEIQELKEAITTMEERKASVTIDTLSVESTKKAGEDSVGD